MQTYLLVQHFFGRHIQSVNTYLSNPDASRIHAVIQWDQDKWLLQDSSSNGTFINGKKLSQGEKHLLNQGDIINFGSLKADQWELLDLDKPRSVLVPSAPELPTLILDKLTVLPSEDNPQISLYLSQTGQWLCESDSGVYTLQSGDKVGYGDSVWYFHDASTCEATQIQDKNEIFASKPIVFSFKVSQDEEDVSLSLQLGNKTVDLGLRAHHYLLLMLARQRLKDKNNGLVGVEQGWVDKEELAGMLRMDKNYINIQIFRFRKQMINELPNSLTIPQAIEKRTGKIRLFYDQIKIKGGAMQMG